MGYSPTQSSYYTYDPTSSKLYSSRHVVFVEHEFPFPKLTSTPASSLTVNLDHWLPFSISLVNSNTTGPSSITSLSTPSYPYPETPSPTSSSAKHSSYSSSSSSSTSTTNTIKDSPILHLLTLLIFHQKWPHARTQNPNHVTLILISKYIHILLHTLSEQSTISQAL